MAEETSNGSCSCGCGCEPATNEYDLKIAILQAALELALKQDSQGEDAPAQDRRFASSCITAFKRSFGID
jgi:hypothetical protein